MVRNLSERVGIGENLGFCKFSCFCVLRSILTCVSMVHWKVIGISSISRAFLGEYNSSIKRVHIYSVDLLFPVLHFGMLDTSFWDKPKLSSVHIWFSSLAQSHFLYKSVRPLDSLIIIIELEFWFLLNIDMTFCFQQIRQCSSVMILNHFLMGMV